MRHTEQRLLELTQHLKPDLLYAHSPVLNVIQALRVRHRLQLPVVHEIRAFREDAAVDHGTTMVDIENFQLSQMPNLQLKKQLVLDGVTVLDFMESFYAKML